MIKFSLSALFLLINLFTLKAQSWYSLTKEADPVVIHTVNDTLSFPIYLVQTENDSTLYFGTHLTTNVCNDQVCLPIEVNIFWDLQGNYHHISKEENVRFTKFDHQYFDDADYQKLNEILLDSMSPLRDYQVEDLLDKNAQKYSSEVDAVTRPTSLLFSNVTVPGALYTVYTLWHIVNGPVKQELYAYLNNQYRARNWQQYFAESQKPGYQEYFLKHLDKKEYKQYTRQVIALLYAEDDFIPHYAIDVLESSGAMGNPLQYNAILQQLDKLKPHVITEFINSLSAPDDQSKIILKSFQQNPKANAKQKELITKILNYEEQ
ncbi:hypothetical protein HP439_04060 [Sphingobacterium shayense]|uniref:hypothetical protein n=1 Tax=Sphingobacterium shayense TaxID=626343 RepID=UPI001551E82C|nr:hypothetical protein [Sphingobacterium shayense]NQD69896.1 hypothetical protein [Sphingobacterium shayense]